MVPQVRAYLCQRLATKISAAWRPVALGIPQDQWTHSLLMRAVDQDGDVVDIMVQSKRDKNAAKRFFRKLL